MSTKDEVIVSKSTFIVSWFLLMLLTGALIAVGTSSMAPLAKDLLILVMMTVQAYLICFYFMHLRYEKLPLIFSVVFGVVVTTLLLYALIILDGVRIITVKW